MKRFQRSVNEGLFAAVLVLARSGLSCAGPGYSPALLPWDQPLDTLAALLSGPIAHAFVALALTVTFLIWT
jgi:type IV secretory pathway VirB2 component (pilin)